jgi:hypothetical protein
MVVTRYRVRLGQLPQQQGAIFQRVLITYRYKAEIE